MGFETSAFKLTHEFVEVSFTVNLENVNPLQFFDSVTKH